MYYVYILKSGKDKSHYIGYTKNLVNRVSEHNSGESKYSRSKTPYNLVWYCAYPSKDKAIAFEKYLKSSSGHAFMNKRFL